MMGSSLPGRPRRRSVGVGRVGSRLYANRRLLDRRLGPDAPPTRPSTGRPPWPAPRPGPRGRTRSRGGSAPSGRRWPSSGPPRSGSLSRSIMAGTATHSGCLSSRPTARARTIGAGWIMSRKLFGARLQPAPETDRRQRESDEKDPLHRGAPFPGGPAGHGTDHRDSAGPAAILPRQAPRHPCEGRPSGEQTRPRPSPAADVLTEVADDATPIDGRRGSGERSPASTSWPPVGPR